MRWTLSTRRTACLAAALSALRTIVLRVASTRGAYRYPLRRTVRCA